MQDNTNQSNEVNENAQSIFSEEEFSMTGYDKHIRQARNSLFAIAILLFINVVILYYSNQDYAEYIWIDLLVYGGFIAAFIALGFWTKKKPYTAIVSGLVLYGLFIFLNAIIDPVTIVKGIIFKVFVIVLLIKGLKDAKEAQALKENFKK